MSPFIPLLMLLIRFVTLFYTVTPNDDGNNIDHAALLAIKSHIISDPHGVLSSWNDSLPVCHWHGVTCGTKHVRRVVGLSLMSKGLVGTLSPHVGNMSFLQTIYLTNNTFKGNIPPQIGNLFRLRYLSLENNTFEGQIPANLSRCSDLKGLGLAGNHLDGAIPSELSHLSSLQVLTLHKNRLVGDLLNRVVLNMTSLERLSAADNFFDGVIPNNIGAVLKNLVFFGLDENKISGTIPPSFYNLSNLQQVGLCRNQLHGTLPSDIGFRLPQLVKFQIGGNSLHGNLPASLSNLTKLVYLSVYSNYFTGRLMFGGENMPNLLSFDVSLNYLGTGEADDLSFIQSLVNCSKLQSLICGSNKFGGSLPSTLGNLSAKLTEVDFGENQIVGTIPLELYNLTSLRRLGIFDNRLTGYISPQIEKLTNLEAFSCEGNFLSGSIPHSIAKLSRLSELYLGKNNFYGAIPSSLGECTNLLYLSLFDNSLSGVLPPQLFHASSMLVKLSLERNHLQGVIPSEIEQLIHLAWLDLSRNSFSGELPAGLSSCTNLENLYMGDNLFSGSIPQSFKALSSMKYLNLSHNKLSGQIPYFLANFPLKELDVSYNNFEGEVPREGVFANLTGLTISRNSNLCGGIRGLHLPRCPAKASRSLSVARIVVIVVACLVVVVSIVSASYFLLHFRKKKNTKSHISSLKLDNCFSKVSYGMLMRATNGFSEANLMGAGHFSSVYRGLLDSESNAVVAVKVIRLEQKGAAKSFMVECQVLRNIRHRNLLKIVTVCSSTDYQGNDFQALVYEFMSNGSLHRWIHEDRRLSLLQRVNIAIDVASAIDYLHNSCDVPLIHCDLKPNNILLDDDMVARVGDFGLARFRLPTTVDASSSVAVAGTVGYAAPEYGLGMMASKEGDIYSFGIVLIEMMTAKSPIETTFEDDLDLHKFAKSALSDQLSKIIDPMLLVDDTSNNEKDEDGFVKNISRIKCIKSLMKIAVKCSMESPQDRMRIEEIVAELRVTRNNLIQDLHHQSKDSLLA